ncbi:uncharacterized protein TNCV_2599961 [Trichonephila clavipes]|nr:uncharacterized protein TNCV_2599961 [Trichonephila clavipes]
MPKSNAQRGKSFMKKEKKKKKRWQQVQSRKKKHQNRASLSSATVKSRSEYMIEYRAWKKTLQNTLLMPSLMAKDENAIETIQMTSHINTNLVNVPVPSPTKSSTSLVCIKTDSCESIKSISPCKDYDSHKTGHKPFQERFADNPFGHGCSICDRLWFRDDLRTPAAANKSILQNILLGINLKDFKSCYNCRQSVSWKSIPNLSDYNVFVYP